MRASMACRRRPWLSRSMSRCGFTLIEVMIAIVVMAVLSLLAWRGLDSMSRTQARLEERAAETAQLTRVLQQLERDLDWRTTVELPADALLQGASPGPSAQARPGTAPVLVPLLPVGLSARRSAQAPLSVELVRAAPAAPGRWQRVRWWRQGDTLYRAAGAAASVYPLPDPDASDRVAVLDDVESFEVRAWAPRKGWQRLPDAGLFTAPASGLEITLALRRGTGPVMRYRQAIALQ
jgi:general secretion pathway protein J